MTISSLERQIDSLLRDSKSLLAGQGVLLGFLVQQQGNWGRAFPKLRKIDLLLTKVSTVVSLLSAPLLLANLARLRGIQESVERSERFSRDGYLLARALGLRNLRAVEQTIPGLIQEFQRVNEVRRAFDRRAIERYGVLGLRQSELTNALLRANLPILSRNLQQVFSSVEDARAEAAKAAQGARSLSRELVPVREGVRELAPTVRRELAPVKTATGDLVRDTRRLRELTGVNFGRVLGTLNTILTILSLIRGLVSEQEGCRLSQTSEGVDILRCRRVDQEDPESERELTQETTTLKVESLSAPAWKILFRRLDELVELLCGECGGDDCVAVVPDYWSPRPGSNRPQLVIYYQVRNPETGKLVRGRTVTVPHFVGDRNWNPPEYRSGGYGAFLELSDGSVLRVYCETLQEAQRVAGLLEPVVDSDLVVQGWRYSQFPNGRVQVQDRVPARLEFYPQGLDGPRAWVRRLRQPAYPTNPLPPLPP